VLGFQLATISIVDAAAGVKFATSLNTVDTPGAVAGQQYTLSAQVQSASANSVVQSACLIALALG